jgi:selenophosphate synthase
LKANREFAECVVAWDENLAEELKILFDPQTAGGLLISVGATEADNLHRELNQAGVSAVEIGEVLPTGQPWIRVAA